LGRDSTTRKPPDVSREHLILLNEALSIGNIEAAAAALGLAAQAYGMSRLAKECGVERTSLYKSLLWGGNPRLETMMKVALVLGIQFGAAKRKRAPKTGAPSLLSNSNTD
jgi:probable addiction module antidote protein